MNIGRALIPAMFAAMTLGCGYSNSSMSTAMMPSISQLSPASTAAGTAQFQLEVDGANFANNAVINFNGTAQATTFVGTGKLEAIIPSSALLNAGTIPVTVTNPASSGRYNFSATTSAPANFMIN